MPIPTVLFVLLLLVAALSGCGSEDEPRRSGTDDAADATSKPATDPEEGADAPDPAQVQYVEEFGTAFAAELTEPGSAEHTAFLECLRKQADGMPSVPREQWPELVNELSAPCRDELASGRGGPIE